jgi:hypothetical protein
MFSLTLLKLILQVELLSLMSTADIRSIGADVLLTWGGRILTGITHPQVSLMTLASGLGPTFTPLFRSRLICGVLKMVTVFLSFRFSDRQNIVGFSYFSSRR